MADPGKFAITTYDGNGSRTNFAIGFPYITSAYLRVQVGGIETGDYTIIDGGTTIQFGTAPEAGDGNVVLFRDTDTEIPTFPPQQPVRGADLTNVATRMFHTIEEAHDLVS